MGRPAASPRRRGIPTRRSDCPDSRSSVPIAPGVGHEAREVALERQLDRAEPAVAVLGDDQVRDPLPFGLLVVVVLAEDEHHEIGVLLDAAAFPQVREHWDRRLALLDAAVELRQGDHRHFELAREGLEAAADLADLLDPVLRAAAVPAGAHELQIVDQHEAEPVRALLGETAALRAYVEYREVRRVVDMQLRLREPRRGSEDLAPAGL